MIGTPENSEWSSSEMSIFNDSNILCSTESDGDLITKGSQSLLDTVVILIDCFFADQSHYWEADID